MFRFTWIDFFASLFVLLAWQPNVALAAACCGGGFAAPALIAGDDQAQVTISTSRTQVVVDSVDDDGYWSEGGHTRSSTLQLQAARLISDRWQWGAGLPLTERVRGLDRSSGTGDLTLTTAYEAWPEWDYEPLIPRGWIYSSLNVPLNPTRFESENGGLDSRGTGLWSLSAGTLLTKMWGPWDAFVNLEGHRSLEKELARGPVRGTLRPGWGHQVGAGLGWNRGDWRLGAGLARFQEDPWVVEGPRPVRLEREDYVNATASASFLASREWALTASWTDQTLFGDPRNTSLGQTAALLLQRRWSR